MDAVGEHSTGLTEGKPLGTPPVLPAEIIDSIIDDLAHDADRPGSTKALRTCTFASRVVCMRAYRYLFSEIKLFIIPSSDIDHRLTKLLDILTTGLKFPDIGMLYHIQSVSFVMILKHYFPLIQLSQITALPEILEILHGPNHGISSLSLEIWGPNGRDPRMRTGGWATNDAQFNDAFQGLCCSRNLKSLHLLSLGEVPDTIFKGTNIEHLTLDDVHIASQNRQSGTKVFSGCIDIGQLKSMKFITVERQFQLNSLLDTIITLHGGIETTENRNHFFRRAFFHLTHLTTMIGEQPAGLRHMLQLHTLRLVPQLGYEYPPEEVIDTVNQFFSHKENATPPSLAHLTVELKVHEAYFGSMNGDNTAWRILESHLAEDRFQGIQDIHLEIHLEYRHYLHQVFLVLSPCVRLHFSSMLFSTRPSIPQTSGLGLGSNSELSTPDGGSSIFNEGLGMTALRDFYRQTL
ncbi:hypothetical protein GALMADRAFT_251596 [Galerina marginata CBS 339.88]|uniref:Uncharacterized protein n=1 Tax=Galerina marginata (strain CBS 339.88) TaxID=685588 RepID=A0A067T430_GALM3|nr:hypothetical protein GALMADRAFT_251596 [Galerina marginata CBS 339.88]